MKICLLVLAAFFLDMLLGDPAIGIHPVILIGKTISFFERRTRKWFPCHETAAGAVTAGCVIFLSFIIPFFCLRILAQIHWLLAACLECWWMYRIFAMKCLKTETMKVAQAVREKDLIKARKQLSYLVGRDTQALSEEEVVKAAVETIAENTTDGVTAPMIFMLLGGAPLGFLYKAVNTLDSMVGYRNKVYIHFGKVSARIDDICNYIPSRITGLFMVLGAYLCRFNGKNAFYDFLHYRNAHLSPNSAQTEAAAAGALGLTLGGTHDYFGCPVVKPEIGSGGKKASFEDILKMNRLMYVTSFLILIVTELIRWTGVMLFG